MCLLLLTISLSQLPNFPIYLKFPPNFPIFSRINQFPSPIYSKFAKFKAQIHFSKFKTQISNSPSQFQIKPFINLNLLITQPIQTLSIKSQIYSH